MSDTSEEQPVQLLSPEWFDRIRSIARADQAFQSIISNMQLSVQFEISSVPLRSARQYYVVLSSGSFAIEPGRHNDPDVTVIYSFETAHNIARGLVSQPHARGIGDLRLSGNIDKLTAHEAASSRFAVLLGRVALTDLG